MLNIYDYIVIGFYFVFVMSLGFVFKKFNKGSKDYFAGGQRMCWWLLGSSLFIANFSCWTFTGAAGVARKYGILIMYIYFMDVMGYIIGYVFFATRLRQMRLITAIDGVRRRFGKGSEQFFNWLSIISAPLGGGVWLFGLAVILTSVFVSPATGEAAKAGMLNWLIVITGVTVLIMAMLGGNWAVAASDFIQMLLLMAISVVTAVLAIVKVGGVGAFFDQLPAGSFKIFYSLGEIKYDWLFLISTIIGSILLRNNIMTASKYIAARDSDHARRSTLIPLIGYSLLPVLWFIPVWASHTLVPELMTKYAGMVKNPEEVAYIASAMQVLPQGLLGLLVVGLFAATMSSMDSAFNKNAGFIVCNFYRDILRPNASDKELFLAGQIATAFCGAMVIGVALLLANVGKISIFDSYLYFAAFFGTGGGVAFLLGMFIKRTPGWAAWSTALVGMVFSIFVFVVLRADWMAAIVRPAIAGTFLAPVYEYIMTNPFFMTYLVVTPVVVAFFFFTMKFYKPERNPKYVKDVDELFKDMNTPVDFNKEIGEENDNSAQQAKTLGILSAVYGLFLLTLVFIPNPVSGRIAIASIALFMLGVGGVLLLAWKRMTQAKKDSVKVEEPVMFVEPEME
jgi:Na+/proline symporter